MLDDDGYSPNWKCRVRPIPKTTYTIVSVVVYSEPVLMSIWSQREFRPGSFFLPLTEGPVFSCPVHPPPPPPPLWNVRPVQNPFVPESVSAPCSVRVTCVPHLRLVRRPGVARSPLGTL